MTFDEFITKFNKNYTIGSEEYAAEQKIYLVNIHNLEGKNCEPCGITKFFDVTFADFEKKILNVGLPDQKVSSKVPNDAVANLNKVGEIDWRKRGVVTSIKDQGECGCSWSFATCALAEISLIMKRRVVKSIDLSEQYLLRCAPNSDCEGGKIEDALKVAAERGIPVDSKYPYDPYKNQINICQSTPNVIVTMSSPISYYSLGDSDIKSLLTLGPLAIAIDATDWEYYSGGIWKCSPFGKVNHAVLLVGFLADGKAWIVKNQWGSNWGENGYIYVSTAQGENCQIGTAVHMLKENLCTKIFVVVAVVLSMMM